MIALLGAEPNLPNGDTRAELTFAVLTRLQLSWGLAARQAYALGASVGIDAIWGDMPALAGFVFKVGLEPLCLSFGAGDDVHSSR